MNKTLSLMVVALSAGFLTSPVLAAEASLPDGLAGFRGILRGVLVSKTDNSLILKVEKIGKTWKENKATNAEAAVGKELTITIAPERERLIKALAERKAGEAVEVGVMTTEANQLSGVEVLRKAGAEEAMAATAAASPEEVARLRARVAELEKMVAELKAENDKLRRQLAQPGATQ